ncbi:hypothetical protein ABZP36_002738 [Zizania latifolia]
MRDVASARGRRGYVVTGGRLRRQELGAYAAMLLGGNDPRTSHSAALPPRKGEESAPLRAAPRRDATGTRVAAMCPKLAAKPWPFRDIYGGILIHRKEDGCDNTQVAGAVPLPFRHENDTRVDVNHNREMRGVEEEEEIVVEALIGAVLVNSRNAQKTRERKNKGEQ